MKFNENQIKAIEELKNCVVVAGAGSGKTAVLSERFINLLEKTDATVESILTLTFTNKAAKEMSERIYKKLLERSGKEKFDAAIKNFKNSTISTFDSFCAKIVRNSSTLIGLPSNFTYDEKRVKRICENKAKDIIIENKDVPVIKELLSTKGFVEIWSNFFVEFARENFYLTDKTDFIETVENRKKFVIENFTKKNDEIFAEFYNLTNDLDRVLKAYDEKSLSDTVKKNLNFFKNREYEKYKNLLEIDKELIFFINSIKLNTKVFSNNEIKERIKKIKEIFSKGFFLINYDAHYDIAKILNDFRDRVISEKKKQGVVNFFDISRGAFYILKNDINLRNYYKNLITHIMVDEFQDTDEIQKNLLYYIAEKSSVCQTDDPTAENLSPNKLFFVGDEKQSIYRFRGADVSVFNGLATEIGNIIKLNTNYRSEKKLINFFNEFFPDVFNVNITKDQNTKYNVSYNSSQATTGKDIDSIITKYTLSGNNRDNTVVNIAKESEFYEIALFIKNSVGKLSIRNKDGGTRFVDYGDFAILFRTLTNQKGLESILKANGIPYNTTKIKSFFDECLVNDILNILKLLIFNDDRLSLIAYFRSPFVNATDDEIYQFIEEKNSCKKIDDALEFINSLSKKVDLLSICEILTEIWHTTGYRYYFERRDDYKSYLDFFEYLFVYANEFDNAEKQLIEFIIDLESRNSVDGFDDYNNRGIDDLKSFGENENGVKIMTIHKSKGLQFPIVIIANLEKGVKSTSDQYFYKYESENKKIDGYVFKLPLIDDYENLNSEDKYPSLLFYDEAKGLDAHQNFAELKRLFYVACTRAESHLLFFGGEDDKIGKSFNHFFPKIETNKGVLGKLVEGLDDEFIEDIRASLEDDFEETHITEDNLADENKKIYKAEEFFLHTIEEIYFSNKKKSNVEYLKNIYEKYKNIEAKKINIFSDEKIASKLSDDKEILPIGEKAEVLPIDDFLEKSGLHTNFGTVVHSAIDAKIKNCTVDENLFLPFEKKSEMIKKTVAIFVDKFFNSKLYSATTKGKIYSEKSFFYLQDDFFIKATIDFYSELEDEIILIDFKTDQFLNPEIHREQMESYKFCLENFTKKRVSAYLWYFRFNRAVEI